MQRTTHSTRAVDLFGSGKSGFTGGTPGVTPATVLTAADANNYQEEICSVIEGAGATPDGSSRHQLLDAINKLIANQANQAAILSETQAAASLRQTYALGAHLARGAAMKFNTLGSVAGFLVVGDSGYLATRIGGGALTIRTPGSSFSGNFSDCCADSNGNYIAVGGSANVQTSTDGASFTQRNSAGTDPLYWVATDGTKILTGGQNGILYSASSATGTYTAMTSPAGSTTLMAGAYANGLWVITTFDGRLYTSPTAANGSWTLKLTVTTSPAFMQGRLSYGALGWSALFNRNSGQYGHAYSTDGSTWTQSPSISGSITLGDPNNLWNLVLDKTMIATDNTSPAVSFLTIGVFTNLSSAPVLSGDCRTLLGASTSNCLPLRLLRLNDQICLLAHDGSGNGFVHLSRPIKNK